MVWSRLTLKWPVKDNLAGHSERKEKTRQTEEEMGRQYQKVDRDGLCKVPKSSGEQGRMERDCCKVISGAPTTSKVTGEMK